MKCVILSGGAVAGRERRTYFPKRVRLPPAPLRSQSRERRQRTHSEVDPPACRGARRRARLRRARLNSKRVPSPTHGNSARRSRALRRLPRSDRTMPSPRPRSPRWLVRSVVLLVRRRPYGKIAGGERLAPCRKSPRKTWRRETTGNRDQQERTLKGCRLTVHAPGHDSPARSVGTLSMSSAAFAQARSSSWLRRQSKSLPFGVLCIDQAALALDLACQLPFRRQDLHVLRGEDLPGFAQNGVLRDRLVLPRTEDQANRRVVALGAGVRVEQADVGIHLPDVLVRQFAALEIDRHATP